MSDVKDATPEELASLGLAADAKLDDLDLAELARMREEAAERAGEVEDPKDPPKADPPKKEEEKKEEKKDPKETPKDPPKDPQEDEKVVEPPKADPPEEDPPKDPPKDPAPQPSRREAKRIQDLLRKYPEPVAPPQPPQPQAPPIQNIQTDGLLNYATELDAPPEILQQLQQDRDKAVRQAYEKAKAELATEQSQPDMSQTLGFETRLEIDAPKVHAKYPVLDPESDKFDAESAEDLNLMYLQMAEYNTQTREVKNPALRYSTFADTMFELANKIATQKTEQATREIVKQAAQTGLRPDGSAVRTKAPDPLEMSDEEFNKAYGLA